MTTSAINNYKNEINWVYEEFKNLGVNCGRIIKRFIKTMSSLSKKPNASIASASSNSSEAAAIYRIIGNEKLTEDLILNAHKKATINRIEENKEKVILNIQDTSELNYTGHKKTTGLGEYGSTKNSRGLIVHTAIAVTTKGVPLGILNQEIWARDPEDRGKSENRRKKPIEEKESYKWLETMTKSIEGFPGNIKVVNICDREGDIYEFYCDAIENKNDFLVRVVHDRRVNEECKLFEKIGNQKAEGTIVVEIPRDTRRNIKKRTAVLEIKYSKVKVNAPRNLPKKYCKTKCLDYYIIQAKEIDAPKGIEPIEWNLATNIEISSLEEAFEKVQWYVHRWKIERFHYVLKSGCEVEKLQERTVESLKKMILINSIIAIRILFITYIARENPEESCQIFLEDEEWKVLYCIVNKTNTLPGKPPTARQAVAYIAKLGGFLGRKSDGEPGVKVIWRGLNELNIVMEHYKFLLPKYVTIV